MNIVLSNLLSERLNGGFRLDVVSTPCCSPTLPTRCECGKFLTAGKERGRMMIHRSGNPFTQRQSRRQPMRLNSCPNRDRYCFRAQKPIHQIEKIIDSVKLTTSIDIVITIPHTHRHRSAKIAYVPQVESRHQKSCVLFVPSRSLIH